MGLRHRAARDGRRDAQETPRGLFETAEDDAAAVDWKSREPGFVGDAGPEDLMNARQGAMLPAQTALDRMPDSHRAAYNLVRQEGLSIAKAATALGTTPMAIKLRVHRA